MRDGCGRAEGGRGGSRNSGRGVANWEGWAQEDLGEREPGLELWRGYLAATGEDQTEEEEGKEGHRGYSN